MKVLKLSAQGLPQSWITLEQAVTHYAAGEVRWEIGAQVALFRGGHNAITGEQSQIAVSSIDQDQQIMTHELRERVKVLEQIITDQPARLADRIESLR